MVQHKGEMCTYRIVLCLGLATCMQKPTRIVVSCDPEFRGGRRVNDGKMWDSAFGSCNIRNRVSYVSDHYKTLIGNRIRRIEWCHLRTPIRQPDQSPKSRSEPVEFGRSQMQTEAVAIITGESSNKYVNFKRRTSRYLINR